MRKRIFIAIFVGVFFVQVLSGCTWFSEEDEYREGFEETDFVAPQVPSDSPHPIINRPDVNESQLPPGYSYNLGWAMGDVYALWGGFIQISLENAGSNDVFIYRYGIEVNWSFPTEWIYEEQNVLIPKGEEVKLGLVYFDAPDVQGDVEYNVILSMFIKDNELFDDHGIESWYDNGTVHGKDSIMNVKPLGTAEDIKLIHNYKYYFDKLKGKVDFENARVRSTASSIIEAYPGNYNIYQVLAIFDFMVNDLTYLSDPEGRDTWAYAEDTLVKWGGDCEDLSIAFTSMIGSIGGTTRIYLTNTHAFSALYIGDETQKNEILDAIRLYYGTDPYFVIFKDDKGYWLAADPAGVLYMGGLPADAEPALVSEIPIQFGFNFIDTKEMHVVDIVG